MRHQFRTPNSIGSNKILETTYATKSGPNLNRQNNIYVGAAWMVWQEAYAEKGHVDPLRPLEGGQVLQHWRFGGTLTDASTSSSCGDSTEAKKKREVWIIKAEERQTCATDTP